MNSISSIHSPISTAQNAFNRTENAASRMLSESHGQNGDVKSTFQDFVAGTFYKQMLSSLHKMHGKPAYLYGGQAEKIFQGQLDQQVAEDLAHSHGSQLSDSLYQAFLHNTRA
jgi:Rod binding domain-containing protein